MPKAHVDQNPTAVNSVSGDPLAVDPESGRVVDPELVSHSEPEPDDAESGAVVVPEYPHREVTWSESESDGEPEPESGTTPYDPTEHTVSEVNTYLDSLDQETEEGIAEFDRVLDAEKAGQNRKGIVG